MKRLGTALLVPALLAAMACSPGSSSSATGTAERSAESPPSILLVTLDTTRADAVGYESKGPETPNLDALAVRGIRFTHAYTTAPQTFPAHASMLTGLYPKDHGVRENGRTLTALSATEPSGREPLAALLAKKGYRTAAFVSGFPLARTFGLAPGFETYDDEFGAGPAERSAAATTDRALAFLASNAPAPGRPLFLWVHYYDPHDPYEPPEPFRSRYAKDPYLGEIAAMDHELGRLLADFETRSAATGWRVIGVGDHGEGRGEHGEAFHGHLLYQGTMRVPLVIAGNTDIPAGMRDEPVSTRRVFDTILGWAGLSSSGTEASLVAPRPEIVLGEAMMPFLDYGWQPQAMAVESRIKVIRSGVTEVYDLAADPHELTNLVERSEPKREVRAALSDYLAKIPASPTASDSALSDEDKKRLASLGYVAGGDAPAALAPDAPNPKDRTDLFRDLDLGSARFVREDYAGAIAPLERVAAKDPNNATARLRLGVAWSILGQEAKAAKQFAAARRLRPDSLDLRAYEGLHLLRFGHEAQAAPLLASVLASDPGRLAALEGLAAIREHEGNAPEAARLLEQVIEKKSAPGPELARLGGLRMAVGDTPGALDAFERARSLEGDRFAHDLEMGVCYLSARRFAEARDALDRAIRRLPAKHPDLPMALFKRAEVAVLLREPESAGHIRRAWERADATTRPLLERDTLLSRPNGS
ncbi:MAG TPA: sulfatase-like hydrolase/transferase [Thermoanaerobaculia bacterium]|nr:sulfatase-like hydrolase/transferase [Thermoanaerobaculia bacterium]